MIRHGEESSPTLFWKEGISLCSLVNELHHCSTVYLSFLVPSCTVRTLAIYLILTRCNPFTNGLIVYFVITFSCPDYVLVNHDILVYVAYIIVNHEDMPPLHSSAHWLHFHVPSCNFILCPSYTPLTLLPPLPLSWLGAHRTCEAGEGASNSRCAVYRHQNSNMAAECLYAIYGCIVMKPEVLLIIINFSDYISCMLPRPLRWLEELLVTGCKPATSLLVADQPPVTNQFFYCYRCC